MEDRQVSSKQVIDAIYETFCYAYCDNCEKEMNEDLCGDCHRKYQNWSASKKAIEKAINNLPSAQPEVAKDTNVLINDIISRQAVRYKLAALVNEFEEILSYIREREVDDSVCGLCEYDGAYIGESGDWCNECPGFEKDDCFKLKEKYRKEWTDING